jgi:DNA-binding HxlR family transcriptional regulator
VEYELTELGRMLRVPIDALATWADTNRMAIQKARDRFDATGRGVAERARRSPGARKIA